MQTILRSVIPPARLRHVAACVFVAVVAAGCRNGGGELTAQQATRAFAANGVHLTEIIRLPEGSLWVVLGPSGDNETCPDEDLQVSLFRRSGHVADYLSQQGLDATKRRHVLASETGTVIGYTYKNLLAAVDAESRCYSESQVESALDDLAE